MLLSAPFKANKALRNSLRALKYPPAPVDATHSGKNIISFLLHQEEVPPKQARQRRINNKQFICQISGCCRDKTTLLGV